MAIDDKVDGDKNVKRTLRLPSALDKVVVELSNTGYYNNVSAAIFDLMRRGSEDPYIQTILAEYRASQRKGDE